MLHCRIEVEDNDTPVYQLYTPLFALTKDMDASYTSKEQEKFSQFSELKKFIIQKTKKEMSYRLKTNPYSTEWEYFIGAFIEMYQYHLQPIVLLLYERGYSIEISSGFSGNYGEGQTLNVTFPISEHLKNTFDRIDVKVQERNSHKSLTFYPKEPDLVLIINKWKEIVEVLPDKKQPASVSMSREAFQFRWDYIPVDPFLKIHRLFERLRYRIKQKMDANITTRLSTKPIMNEVESRLGVFLEMLEPQVRDAVVVLNQKGYSTDASGFMNQVEGQMIEGDFRLSDETLRELEVEGVIAETNPSGYTRLQFRPDIADVRRIKQKWNRIASIIPDKGMCAQPSMTKKSRELRSRYSSIKN